MSGPTNSQLNVQLTLVLHAIIRYQKGPQPAELGGQRALDFVLDNDTLQNFNRPLLMDIKLLAVRKGRQ